MRIPKAYTIIWKYNPADDACNIGTQVNVPAGIDLDYAPTICNLHYHWNKMPRFIPPKAKAVFLQCLNVDNTTIISKNGTDTQSTTRLLLSISLEDILKPAVGPGYGPFYMTHKTGDEIIFKAGYDCTFNDLSSIEVFREFDMDVTAVLSFNII